MDAPHIAHTNLASPKGESPLTRSIVYVVIPTYNEAENLPTLVNTLFALPVPNLHIIIVDDNSPDGTGEIADDLRWQNPGHTLVIHRPGKLGLGSAYLEGFRLALNQGADFILQMDADFSHSPDYIPQFLRYAYRYDVILGSRYTLGGRLDPHWSWWRYALSWWANSFYVRFILGLKVQDATGGFKCWSRKALKAVLQHPISSSGYIFQVEMNYLAEKLGFHLMEMPIYFKDRRIGRSKMSTAIKLEAIWRTWYLRLRYRNVRPTLRITRSERVTRPLKVTVTKNNRTKR